MKKELGKLRECMAMNMHMCQYAVRLYVLQVYIPQMFSCLGHMCQPCLRNLNL